MKLKLWHPIAGLVLAEILEILNDNVLFQTGIWFLIYELINVFRSILLLLIIYILIRNIVRAIKGLITRRNYEDTEELERQREIERKEINMVRKSNEILLHLIQDEHREKDC